MRGTWSAQAFSGPCYRFLVGFQGKKLCSKFKPRCLDWSTSYNTMLLKWLSKDLTKPSTHNRLPKTKHAWPWDKFLLVRKKHGGTPVNTYLGLLQDWKTHQRTPKEVDGVTNMPSGHIPCCFERVNSTNDMVMALLSPEVFWTSHYAACGYHWSQVYFFISPRLYSIGKCYTWDITQSY